MSSPSPPHRTVRIDPPAPLVLPVPPSPSRGADAVVLPPTNVSPINAADTSALVDSVLSPHDQDVDLRRVITAVWTHRADKEFTFELCARLSRLNITAATLEQAEFYLPQLAHMVIHFETELPVNSLEQFVLLLAQSSTHLALQFFWMVYATLDENRPKRGGNLRTFARCAQLLLSLEQCVVYGTPIAREASDLLTRQSISKQEMDQIVLADRQFFAAQSTVENNDSPKETGRTSGWLFKKGGGTSTMGRRNWTSRWCRLENRMLLVFAKPSDLYPRTAVPIAGSAIVVSENAKHPHYFEVVHALSETRAKFSAPCHEELVEWVDSLSKSAYVPEPPSGSSPTKKTSPSKGSPTRAISRMSFAMRSFILESLSGTDSPRSGSPTKSSVDPAPTTPAVVRLPSPTASWSQTTLNPPHQPETSGNKSPRHGRLSLPALETFVAPGPELPADQATRSEFFSDMIHFIKSITDVPEVLRRTEPIKRKALLQPLLDKIKVPPYVYIPLCKATEPFCMVRSVIKTEGRVFNTNERAPCLLYFETIQDPVSANVTQALFDYLHSDGTFIHEEGDVTLAEVSDDDVALQMDNEALETAVDASSRAAAISQEDGLGSRWKTAGCSVFVQELLQDDERKQRLESVFGELSYFTSERLRIASSSGTSPHWRLSTLIAKSFDDLRQEVLVMQLLSFFQQIFEQEQLPLWLRPYRILSTGASTGMLEVIRNASSLDGVKKTPGFKNLRTLFRYLYGTEAEQSNSSVSDDQEKMPRSPLLRQAELNFMHSLAAYAIVCYVLAVKDRHNGNIMLDIEGHIIHIDFGFLLGRAPGGSFSFETAPFKLTTEMVEVIGGRTSANFHYFSDLVVRGALATRKHAESLFVLVETMSTHSKMPCFANGAAAPLAGLRERLFLNVPEDEMRATVLGMVERAFDHFGTTTYDQFQVYSNGIAK